MRLPVAVLISFLTAAAHLAAGDFNSGAIGTTGAGFLSLGMGARPIAMGGAYSAVADDASAVFWNPAGLVRSEGASIMFMHASYFAGISFDYLSFAASKGGSAFGGSMGYLNAGSIAQQTEGLDDPQGSYQPRDYYGTLSYASDLEIIGAEKGRFSAGLSAKFLSSNIIEKAQAFAFDAGLTGRLEMFGRTLRLGFVAQNIGPGIKYENETDPLPAAYRLGGAVSISRNWLLAAEVAAPRANSPYVSAGAEHMAYSSDKLGVFLRAGVNTLTLSGISGLNGVSAGMGLAFSRVSMDYAATPFGELGLTHRLSMTLRFAGSQKEQSLSRAGKRDGAVKKISTETDTLYFLF